MNDLNKLFHDIVTMTERVFESGRYGRPMAHHEFDMLRRDIDRIVPSDYPKVIMPEYVPQYTKVKTKKRKTK